MSTVIKTKNKSTIGQLCLYPGIGDQVVSEAGTIEGDFTEEQVAVFLAGRPDFFVGEEEIEVEEEDKDDELQKTEEDELNPKSDEDELGGDKDKEDDIISKDTTPADDKADEDDEPTDEEKKLMVASLIDKTRKELEVLCANFPGGEWRGKNKEKLVEYLTEKLS